MPGCTAYSLMQLQAAELLNPYGVFPIVRSHQLWSEKRQQWKILQKKIVKY